MDAVSRLLANAFGELNSDADAEIDALRAQSTIAFSIDVLRSMTDFDRDDYSGFLSGGDCAPFDASRNPGMPEIAGNGIDDNCLYGDAKTPESDTSGRFDNSEHRQTSECPSEDIYCLDYSRYCPRGSYVYLRI